MRAPHSLLFAGAAVLAVACEDGPEQLFTPNTGDPPAQNGMAPATPWTPRGEKAFGDESTGDSAGRARFCDEGQTTTMVQNMVVQPIIPDVSIGGIPLWGPGGKALHADDLIGKPEDGKFCDPSSIYSDAFTWGPTDEVIVYFNQETRLVEGIIAYQQYLGTLEGSYTGADGSKVPVVIRPRERVKIDGRELDQYTSRADQARNTSSWLNYANVTAVYKMVRETFFNAPPFPADFDCVTAKLCDLIYTSASEATPQDTFIVIQDSGVQVRLQADGHATFVYLEPVRVAPFEGRAKVQFGAEAAPQMTFAFASEARPACTLDLESQLTFATFKSRCIDAGDNRTLSRVNYDVATARDSVQVKFNGMDLGFIRRISQKPLFRDGEGPADDDVLHSIAFSRSLSAPVAEFRAQSLGLLYKEKLEQRLKNSIVASSASVPLNTHPFWQYTLEVPFIFDAPQRIGELSTIDGRSWVSEVIKEIGDLYSTLSPEQREVLDPRVLDPVYLVEPFVDGVLEAFSHGEGNAPGAWKAFRTTDDRRWSIGFAHFVRAGVPYRVMVQYSLNFGAVTYVTVERGYSELDQVLETVRSTLDPTAAYYTADLARIGTNPYALGGTGIVVRGFDRRLETLDVDLPRFIEGGTTETISLTVSGDPIQDKNGYLRQIRGERYEFVPADVVRIAGRETNLTLWIEADGKVGRVSQSLFKGSLELCAGLTIEFGDSVRSAVDSWVSKVSPETWRDCEIVYNYSENGNVLDSVASLSNRVSFAVIDERAVSAALWR